MGKGFKMASSIFATLLVMASVSTTALAQTTPKVTANTSQATYVVTIGSETVTLAEGQKAQFLLTLVNNSRIHSDVVFPGDGGTLDIWPQNGRVYYSISMDVPATSFSGLMRVTDLTSGLGGGSTSVSGFSGNVPTSNLYGHQYGASLSGEAYFLGIPVASTVPNYIVWTAS